MVVDLLVANADSEPDDFTELNDLRLFLDRTLSYATLSLSCYRDEVSGGFTHLLSKPKSQGEFSKASTATCLVFLDAAGLWTGDWAANSEHLRDAIIGGRWGSSGLDEHNPFTISFLLEALHVLSNAEAPPTEAIVHCREPMTQIEVAQDEIERLRNAFSDGGVAIVPYPPTAFLTYKAVHALKLWNAFDDQLAAGVRRWAWAALNEESVLVASASPNADVFELAYAALTVSAATQLQDMTPPQRDTLSYVIDQFFGAQLPEGVWPRSRPLFLYPRLGNAYCYSYELLVHLLDDQQLRPMLLRNLGRLSAAARAVERGRFPLGDGAWGWSSGHLRQVSGAESWSTAAVFQYCHALSELVGDAVRRSIFEYVEESAVAVVPSRPISPVVVDENRFVDSNIEFEDGNKTSLSSVLAERFLGPLVDAIPAISKGQVIPSKAPTSAILYGPPGTSKTQLAAIVADVLGWPLLKLDPSHLTRLGLDRLHAEAYRLFTMLGAAERIVVLFDEFDELVREREAPNEALSRFLTTAMLPKITTLRERRKLVFILATNHLEVFDSAIARPGRFDMIVPVLPPSLEAKLRRWSGVRIRAAELGIDFQSDTRLYEWLADLTYAEFGGLVTQLESASTKEAFRDCAGRAWEKCTMESKSSDGVTWRDRIKGERRKIRIP